MDPELGILLGIVMICVGGIIFLSPSSCICANGKIIWRKDAK